MKNTKRKDFNTTVQVGTIVKLEYNNEIMTFNNIRHNNMSLWEMCECIMGRDLQNFWDYNLECSEEGDRKYRKEEERLMNLVKITFL